MMIEILREAARLLAPFCQNNEETLLLSYLQGYMGRGWTDNVEHPRCVAIVVGDFCFFAGDTGDGLGAGMMDVLMQEYADHFLLLIPDDRNWEQVIEAYWGDKVEKFTRYATKKHTNFNPAALEALINKLPSDYRIEVINQPLYKQIMEHPQLRDLCSNFRDWDEFLNLGIGYCITCHGKAVAGASSYTVYRDGIEIEIDTDKEHRCRGLAAACGSRLILRCLELGKYPSWDAHNLTSLRLAERLGYKFSHEYTAYEVSI